MAPPTPEAAPKPQQALGAFAKPRSAVKALEDSKEETPGAGMTISDLFLLLEGL